MANSNLESFYEYPSGVLSFGKDKTLNGVYGNTFGMVFNLELSKQWVLFNRLGLEVGATLNTLCLTTDYYDPSYAKGINVSVNYAQIPVDFSAWYPTLNNFEVYEGKNIRASNASLGAFVRLSYYLKSKS